MPGNGAFPLRSGLLGFLVVYTFFLYTFLWSISSLKPMYLMADHSRTGRFWELERQPVL